MEGGRGQGRQEGRRGGREEGRDATGWAVTHHPLHPQAFLKRVRKWDQEFLALGDKKEASRPAPSAQSSRPRAAPVPFLLITQKEPRARI